MNEKIRNISKKILSDNWYVLHKYIFEYKNKNNEWQLQEREAYDRGNGATILLYNRAKKTVVLTKQFRLPTYINGNATGLLIEACAGLLERDNAADCIVREAHEETGYRIDKPQKIFEAYMSPGSVTELLHFFIAEYTENDKTGEGGGLASEQENIEVLELDFATAYAMIAAGDIVDGKTIMLLQYAKINNLFQ